MSDPTKITLPDSLTISGTALVSETMARGHGWHLRTAGIEALASHPPVHLVADHDRSIAAVAGTASMSGVRKWSRPSKRRPKAAQYAADAPLTEEFQESVAALDFSAVLSPMHLGFEKAVRHVLALRADKRTPNVSVRILAAGIDYEAQLDKVYFEPPYSLEHVGIVDNGALNPSDGVGVWSVAEMSSDANPVFNLPAIATSFGSDPAIAAHLTITVANGLALVAEFAERHLADPALLELVGARLGLDGEAALKAKRPATLQSAESQTADAEPSNTSTAAVATQDASKASPSETPISMAETTPANPPAPTGGVPAAPAQPAAQVPVELASLRTEMQAELASLRKARADAEAAELASVRSKTKADHSLEDADLASFGTVAQLQAVSALLEKKSATGNPLRRQPPGVQVRPDAEREAHLKSIDDGRLAFLTSAAIKEA